MADDLRTGRRGWAAARDRRAQRSGSEAHPMVHSHRDLTGGALRAAIFGVSDGLVSNVSLVLGTSGAHPGGGFVRLAGLAGLFGGSFSMAAGEYVSMRGQREVLERELDIERTELADRPAAEQSELEHIYVRRGLQPDIARQVASELMSDPEMALATHAREELGIDPHALGAPVKAAVTSFVTFGLGALVPLLPFLGASSSSSTILISIALTAAAAIGVGAALSALTNRPRWYSALRSLGICAAAGALTYGIGSLIGVSTG